MTYLLCRNQVDDFATWKRAFDSHLKAHRDAGLEVVHLWRSLEDPNDVFVLFQVETIEHALELVNAPKTADPQDPLAITCGQMHFLEGVAGY